MNIRPKSLFLVEDCFDSCVSTLTVKWDQIPNPTKETREVHQVPVKAHRWVARNLVGRLLLKYMWRTKEVGPASLTEDGKVMVVCPLSGLV